jgi:hypothetical protein
MNIETELAISAALDSEPTDIEMLRKALATEEGREILVSFVLLRAQVAADDLCPGHVPKVPEQLPQQPSLSTSRSKVWWRLKPRFSWRVAAASFAILALACAFWLGTSWRAMSGLQSADRRQDQTMAGQKVESGAQRPGTASSAQTSYNASTRQQSGSMEPPKPARVLRFVPGTDWHSDF